MREGMSIRITVISVTSILVVPASSTTVSTIAPEAACSSVGAIAAGLLVRGLALMTSAESPRSAILRITAEGILAGLLMLRRWIASGLTSLLLTGHIGGRARTVGLRH